MNDARHIENGWEIPSEGYCDQPRVVVLEDGAWACVMTTGTGREGQSGQHVVSTRSTDQGRTWSPLVDVEPADGPEASWAVALATPAGRVYAFYTFNAENLREMREDPDTAKANKRVDTLGEYCFRFSDDGGRTWSADRYTIPVRAMAVDRGNPYGGEVRFFWGVNRPIVHDGAAMIPFAKIRRFGPGFMAEDECCFLRSENILTEPDPARIAWQTLPEGDHGLRPPEGPIAEEPSIAALSDGSLVCFFRTVAGHPGEAYSRDGGRTWTEPRFMAYEPGGDLVCNPRACCPVWRLRDGRFLFWFHNHNGRGYEGRNPAWLLGGTEVDAPDGRRLRWSRPEVVLYDETLSTTMSYPDLVEAGDRLVIAETQKTVARVHEIDPALIARLFEE